jgi:hypothetical protein
LPARHHAGAFGAFRQDPMKQASANAQAAIVMMWEAGLGFEFIIHKTYAAKRRPMLGPQLHADATQGCQPIRHQAFAASFVDGRSSPIRDNNLKAALTSCKRSSQSGWTATNYDDVGL